MRRPFIERKRVKVYIITDLEGVAGVIDAENHAYQGSRFYEMARQLTTAETNAAIEGALEAGATEILVLDGHGQGGIDPLSLHPAAQLLAGRPLKGYPFGFDTSFDAALTVGQHAKSNTDGGHICHTISFAVEEMTINGVSVGEMGCNMLFCAYFGVPMVMVAGDRACCEEAHALVPSIETAAVKEGMRRGAATDLTPGQNERHNGAAIHLHPERARALIREAARRGLERRSVIPRFWLEPPYELVQVMRPTEEQPARIARVRGDDLIEVLNAPRQYEPVG